MSVVTTCEIKAKVFSTFSVNGLETCPVCWMCAGRGQFTQIGCESCMLRTPLSLVPLENTDYLYSVLLLWYQEETKLRTWVLQHVDGLAHSLDKRLVHLCRFFNARACKTAILKFIFNNHMINNNAEYTILHKIFSNCVFDYRRLLSPSSRPRSYRLWPKMALRDLQEDIFFFSGDVTSFAGLIFALVYLIRNY